MADNSIQELQFIWDSTADYLKKNSIIPETAFNLWFSNVKLIELTAENAIFSCENDFKLKIVKDKYQHILEDALLNIIGYKPEVNFVEIKVKEEDKNPSFTEFASPNSIFEEEEDEEVVSTIPKGIGYNSDYTFDNFIVGKSNQFAHAAALAVAKNPASDDYNPLLIYGPSGLGKTHLMYAIANSVLSTKPNLNIIYVKGEEFTNQLIDAISNKSTQAFRNKYRKADMLLIDDIQFIAGKISTQEEFFHTFNALYEDHKQIILTSDRPPKDMATLEDRIKSRFESGVLADIQPPDFELRLAILRYKAEQINLDIPMEILNYLAENLHENVRKIEGVIKKLSAKALLTGNPITLEMAKEEIPMYSQPQETKQDIAKKILQITSKKYGISIEDILGQKRTKDIKNPRNIAMYVIHKVTDMSLNDIGKLTNRDHATVYSNIKAISEDIKNNSYTAEEVQDIINEIKQ